MLERAIDLHLAEAPELERRRERAVGDRRSRAGHELPAVREHPVEEPERVGQRIRDPQQYSFASAAYLSE